MVCYGVVVCMRVLLPWEFASLHCGWVDDLLGALCGMRTRALFELWMRCSSREKRCWAWSLKQVDNRGCNKRGKARFEDDASVDYE